MFKVEIRKDCKVCGQLITGKRYRTYCSEKCRNKQIAKVRTESGKGAEAQRRWADKKSSVPSDRKVQCLVCGLWYVQIGTHVIQRHDFESARAYREHFGLEVKRGTVPAWYREMKGEQAIENGTVNNLKIGKKFWFKPGQEGLGKYERSPITIERLRNQFKKK